MFKAFTIFVSLKNIQDIYNINLYLELVDVLPLITLHSIHFHVEYMQSSSIVTTYC